MSRSSLGVIGAAALAALVGVATADDFEGTWEVTRISNERKDGPGAGEIKYPKRMVLQMRDGRLVGHYVDQYDHPCDFDLVAVVNQGHDLLLVHCGETKAPESYAPIHHVKLRGNTLHGVVTTSVALFEWVAERRK